jgi:hypothetical protein
MFLVLQIFGFFSKVPWKKKKALEKPAINFQSE